MDERLYRILYEMVAYLKDLQKANINVPANVQARMSEAQKLMGAFDSK